jgi:FAD/FMN-containing dehydrogenase
MLNELAGRNSMIGELGRIVGDERVSRAPPDLEHYGRDWAQYWEPSPFAVVFPETISEVAQIIRSARKFGVPVVPSGGRTGLSGGAVACRGELVLSMERMRVNKEFNLADRTLRVEAGVTTHQAQEYAREAGLFYPVDFASRGSSQIGGNVATNAGGIRVLRYGMTRSWVAGLKVVTGAGEVLDLNQGLSKNATGYDLRHLFIGSEGTLGVICEVTLQLTEPPPPQQVMVLGVPSLDALMMVFDAVRRDLNLSAFEFFCCSALRNVVAAGAKRPFESSTPFYVLVEFDEDEQAAVAAFESLGSRGLVTDGVIGRSLAQSAEMWRLREGITESLAHRHPYKNDIAVRVSRVPAFLGRMEALFAREYPRFEVVWFGHFGDGNLHISILPPEEMGRDEFQTHCQRVTELLAGVLQEFGGTISAEHGIGLLKRDFLHRSRSPVEIDLMRETKRVFDPAGIMNPGKLFPP